MKRKFWELIVGDCLSSPIQFTPKDNHPYIMKKIACPTFRTLHRYWKNNSSMASCMAESVVRLHRYSLEDIVYNFVRWYREGLCSSLDCAFDVFPALKII